MKTTQEPRQKQSRYRGLTQAEVETNRQKYGSNLLTPPKRSPWWKLWLEKFDDPVIRILIIAAVIAITVGIFEGNYVEGLGIIAAIILATSVAFLNEYKASKEFDILNQVNDEIPIAVIRDNKVTTVPKKDLVVGDIVLIETGDEIAADGQVLEAVSLQVNEASLTGEAIPVAKVADVNLSSNGNSGCAYPPNKVLRDTVVNDGHGVIEIIAVGDETEIGKTARCVLDITDVETPLNLQLERLSNLIGILGLVIAVLIDIALVARGIFTGELDLTSGQWYIISVLTVSLTVALTRVWLPIIVDGLESIGKEIELPEWLENDSGIAWVKNILLALAISGIGIGVGYYLEWVPTSPTDWISADVAVKFLTYFMIAVAVIVVAVPEGLALSVTLSLAYSMQKMTQQNNLVRRMHACETIGATTVICSDKTGTLTENKMQVSDVNFPSFDDKTLNADNIIVEAICSNSTANLEYKKGEESIPLGDHTEGALLLWLEENNIDYIDKRDDFDIVSQLTFSADRKYMATMGNSSITGDKILHIKGAPELLLASCHQIMTAEGVKPFADSTRVSIAAELNQYETIGRRTLGFAYIRDPQDYQQGKELEQYHDLIWLGFVAIADPVREEVPNAVKICQKAGVKVKMITGDSRLTAVEIAREIGIISQDDPNDYCITGGKLRSLDDEVVLAQLKKVKVIARARPQDKQRIVQLLQTSGEVVAVTGDGTNDAPALNQAQVGLSMGSGTSVAKEASDIIILNDSFASIENAVMWGRSLYQNIQKFILFQLTINVAACGIALLGPFIGINLPFTVIQLLWVNLIMDTFAALALATEPPNPKVMENTPRNSQDFIISKPMMVSIFSVAAVFLVFFVAFLLYIQKDRVVTPYELSLFFTTFVMLQFWNMFNAKCFGLKESAFSNISKNGSFIAIAAFIFVGQILMVQFGGAVFRTVPLSLRDWLVIIGGTSIVLWIGEIWRMIQMRFKVS
ncbi:MULTISPECIES: calcium-translocating P-type ATPase, PMCA-type [unclassified Okeania]|uniref:calcium-translocating P-type ATPase, PMCA-type n=1 Tax=unclassified Okeania TaxID=2634635 RepID=UPI0013B9100A|nr:MULTISPECIES: calcium-translocating P-type ATPase, PMCA-type [unclassified Okeania]NES74931.1 calcium-translocating P-type ATPase, PMCA-type [Okeania sp. SIO1H4]NET18279.1 calcium-translocating P-type ATPase, PMCA-type [Okeania sp. SIO1H5]NET92010.1 calcium-translocating P-type ATPase, PMCA-type [Okeania sp. SIO1H2]